MLRLKLFYSKILQELNSTMVGEIDEEKDTVSNNFMVHLQHREFFALVNNRPKGNHSSPTIPKCHIKIL